MKTHGTASFFQVSSVGDSLKYYKDVLGFTEDFRFGDNYAGVRHGEAALHLCGHSVHERPVGGGSAFIFCDEVEAYYEAIKKKEAIVKLVPEDRPYGMRDFTVTDLDGNHLGFGCEIKK